MPWIQVYDPLGNAWLSTLVAALPIVLLLVALAVFEWKAHWAALAGLTAALLVSVVVYGMPVSAAAATAVYGAAYGLFPIGWIILAAVFLYNLTVRTGQFDVVKASVARLSADRRIQALLVAFSFGAFIEGAAGFGTPVAITAALLMGLGFTPLYSAGLSLIANTAPVAYGAIGTPILTLGAVTGIDPMLLSAMAGRQLPIVSLIVPAWLVVTMSGWKGLRGVWPAVLVSGGSFAIVQFWWSNYVGPELVDIVGGLVSLGCLALFCTWWRPAEAWEFPDAPAKERVEAIGRRHPRCCASCVRGEPRVDALGIPVGVRDRLGHRSDQGLPECRPCGHAELSCDWPPAAASCRAVAGVRRARPAPHGLPRSPGGSHAGGARPRDRSGVSIDARRGGAVHAELAVGHRHRDSLRRVRYHPLPAGSGGRRSRGRGADPDQDARAADDHCLHAVARIRHPVRRHGCDTWTGVHADRLVLSVLRRHAGMARAWR